MHPFNGCASQGAQERLQDSPVGFEAQLRVILANSSKSVLELCELRGEVQALRHHLQPKSGWHAKELRRNILPSIPKDDFVESFPAFPSSIPLEEDATDRSTVTGLFSKVERTPSYPHTCMPPPPTVVEAESAESTEVGGKTEITKLPAPLDCSYETEDDSNCSDPSSKIGEQVLNWERFVTHTLNDFPTEKQLDQAQAQNFQPELAPAWCFSKQYTQSKMFCMYLDKAAEHQFERRKRHSSIFAVRAGDCVIDTGYGSRLGLRPNAPLRIFWNMLGGFFIMYDSLVIPLLVFEIRQVFFLDFMYYLTLGYWALDVPLNFITGFHKDGRMEMRLGEIARNYGKTWLFCDLVVLTVDVFVLMATTAMSDSINGLGFLRISRFSRVLRILRMIRLCRIFKLGEVVTLIFDVLLLSQSAILMATLCQNILTLFFMNHYIACAWYGIASMIKEAGWAKNTWVKVHNLENATPIHQYAMSLHWSLTQFTPSTNNIAPVALHERIFAIIVVLSALIGFSHFLSSITSLLTQLRALNADQRREECCLRDFLSTRRVKIRLRDRIWRFFRNQNRQKKKLCLEDSIVFLKTIPESMLIELHREIYFKPLMSSSIFNPLSHVEVVLFEKVCHLAMCESLWIAQQDVFVSGYEATRAFVVTSGRLRYCTVFDNYENHLVQDGDWISEVGLWIKWMHCGQFCAERSSSSLIELNCSAFQELVHSWGGPLCNCLKKFAVFLLGHLEGMTEKGRPVTDLSLGHDVLEGLAVRALRLERLKPKFGLALTTGAFAHLLVRHPNSES